MTPGDAPRQAAETPAAAPPARGRAARSRWWRRWLWRLTMGILALAQLLLLLGYGTLVYLRTDRGRETLRAQILQRAAARLPGLRIGRITGDYTTHLGLEGVVLADRFGGEAIRVDRVSVRFDLRRLRSRQLQLDEVRLVRPRVVLRPAQSGNLNLTELLAPGPTQPAPPAAGEPSAWQIKLGALRIEEGAFEAPALGAKGLRVTALGLDASGSWAAGRVAATVRRCRAQLALPDGRRLRAGLELHATQRGEEIVATARIEAQDERSRTPVVLDARATGTLPALAVQLDGTLPDDGTLRLRGTVGLQAGVPVAALALTLTHIVPAAIVPGLDLPAATIGLNLATKLRGVPLTPGSEAHVELELTPGSRALGYRLDELALHARTTGATYTLERLHARAYGATLTASARGTRERLDDSTLRLVVPSLARVPMPGMRGAGSAHLSASAVGPLTALRGHVALRGRGLRVPGLAIGTLALEADARDLPELGRARGRVRIVATRVDPGDPRLRLDTAKVVLDGGLTSLNLTATARGPQVAADLALKSRQDRDLATIRVSLQRLKVLALGYRAALRRPSQVTIRPGRDIVLPTTDLAALGGAITVTGRYRPGGFPRAEARIVLRGVRPPKSPRLSGELNATLGRRELTARIDLRLPRAGRLQLATSIPVRYRGGTPAPAWRRAGRVTLRAEALDLGALLERALGPRRVAGIATLALDASGELGDPRLDANLRWVGARLDEVASLDGDLTLAVRPGQSMETVLAVRRDRPLATLRVRLAASLAPLFGGHARRWLEDTNPAAEVQLTLAPTTLKALGALHPALADAIGSRQGRVAAGISVRGSPLLPRVEARLQLSDLVLTPEARPTALGLRVTAQPSPPGLDADAAVTLDARPALQLQAAVGLDVAALLAGRDPTKAPLAARVTIHDTALGALVGLVPALQQATGTLAGRITATGSVGQPRAETTFSVRGAGFQGVAVGDLGAQAQLEPRRDGLSVDAKLQLEQAAAPDGQRGSLTGAFALTLAPGGLEKSRLVATLRGQRLDLTLLSRLTPELQESGGKLSLQLDARGVPTHPALAGTIDLRGGVLRPRGMTALQQIEARLVLSPGKVTLPALTLSSARGGTLRASGAVELDAAFAPQRFTLQAVAEQLKLDVPGAQNLKVSGEVTTTGQREAGVLNARVRVREGELWLPKLAGGRELHATAIAMSDVRFVDGTAQQQRAPRPAPRAPAATRPRPGGATLLVEADPLFVRSEELDIEVAAALTARTDDRGRPRIGGWLAIRRGTVRILGNDYRVERARLSFSERATPDPALDVSLSREMAGVTVYIGVRGMASDPELVLRGEPPQYDRAQLLSLVLTGRVDPRKGSDSGDRSTALATAAANALVGGILSNVLPKVSLIDTARLGIAQSRDATTGAQQVHAEAEIGKYITRRLYLAIRRVFGFGGRTEGNLTEALLEYRISARWLLVALFGDAGVGGVDLMWSYRY